MAQVVRLTCGKCGGSITLVSKEKVTKKEGEELGITCGQAQKIYAAMGGCDDSLLKISKVKGERPLKPSDPLLEDFAKRAEEEGLTVPELLAKIMKELAAKARKEMSK